MPQRVTARIAGAVDHFAEAALDLFARNAGALRDRVGEAIAPCLPDPGEGLTRNSNGVDDDVVDGDVAHLQIVQHGEHLSADVEIAADRLFVSPWDDLPESVRAELGPVAPQHAVVFGDEVRTSAGAEDAANLFQHLHRVGDRLQQVPADDEIELLIGKRQRERIADLESHARTKLRTARSRASEMLLLEVDADERRARIFRREPLSDLAGTATDVQHRSASDPIAVEDRLLLRPDGLRSINTRDMRSSGTTAGSLRT
ncbi:MAG TPA: hypothetical protein VKL19_09315 [Thermoanaerobaculia bacterium]|nr:hypothetical protein [Thermoanaerobaculia bacterium]